MPIPATAAAMMKVAAQPTVLRTPDTGNLPMISGFAVITIITTITGTATIPLMTALQNSALIGLIDVKFIPTPIIVAYKMVDRRLSPPLVACQTRRPLTRLAVGIGGGAGQYGHCKKPRPHNTQCEDYESESARNRFKRFGRLSGRFNFGHASNVKRRGSGHHNRQRHQIRKCHTQICIGANAAYGIAALPWRFHQRHALRFFFRILGFLGCLPKNRYGLIVVPNIATIIAQNFGSDENVGRSNPRSASAHGISTTITVPKYANSGRVSHFSTETSVSTS